MYIPLTYEGAFPQCLIASSSYNGTFISGGFQYEYHIFTASFATTSSVDTTFEVYTGTLQAELLVVGAGGGGSADNAPGGGGGGQVLYFPNQRFYKGIYNINIGYGGAGGLQSAGTKGQNGNSTTIVGSNFSYTAIGGNGATGSTGGTSGNGFVGGTGSGVAGGGGGGSTTVGQSVNVVSAPAVAGDGGTGSAISFANIDSFAKYGCGGGGGSNTVGGANAGTSCYGSSFGNGVSGLVATAQDGAPNRGTGGGGGWFAGGRGGTGIVIIQYKVNDYCKDFFNETGSCGCRQITFNSTVGATDPYLTDKLVYTPCGTNLVVTESVMAFYPKTICATSGTFYSGPSGSTNYIYGMLTGSLSFSECSTGSICGDIPSYTATCSSSYTTYFNTTERDNGIYYVPRNGTQIALTNMTRQSGSYICASDNYPSGSTTPYAVIVPGTKCLHLRYDRTISPSSGNQVLYWYDCSNTLRSQTFTYPGTNTFDFTASFATSGPWMTTGFASWTTIGYLGTSTDYTGSLPTCGCP